MRAAPSTGRRPPAPPAALALALAVLALVMAPAAGAASLETAPTTIELAPGSRAGVLYVSNRGDRPLAFQVEAFDWSQDGGGDRLTPSASLEVSPPIAELAPGGTQIVRLRAAPRAGGASERAYRLVVSELPPPGGGQEQQVRVLLQFNMPVFERAPSGGRAALAWDAVLNGDRLVLTATNSGARRSKFTDAQLVAAAAGRRAVAGGPVYVLAGASRVWTAPAAGLKPGDSVAIESRDGDSGKLIAASVVIRP